MNLNPMGFYITNIFLVQVNGAVPMWTYPVISPASNPNRKILERFVGNGHFKWNVARWEDMPTQYTIINTLADLEIKEFTSGSLKRTIGDHDLSQINQKILE